MANQQDYPKTSSRPRSTIVSSRGLERPLATKYSVQAKIQALSGKATPDGPTSIRRCCDEETYVLGEKELPLTSAAIMWFKDGTVRARVYIHAKLLSASFYSSRGKEALHITCYTVARSSIVSFWKSISELSLALSKS